MCEVPGAVRFAGLTDRWHGVPGLWDVRHCEPCQTLWMDPEPLAEEIPRLYPTSYPTHDAPWDVLDGGPGRLGRWRRDLKWQVLASAYGYGACARTGVARAVGIVLARIPAVRRQVGLNNVRLVAAPAGRLLDVGCGNGGYLLSMSRLGWTVEGLEPDGAAAEQARRAGFTVRNAPVAECQLEPASFDVIVLHHVLEHLPDPADALARLARALRPGGRLVSMSPNPVGAASRYFGPAWRALDVPRHLVLPGPAGLRLLAVRAGLKPRLGGSSRMTRGLTRESLRESSGHGGGLWWVDVLTWSLRVEALWQGGDEVILEARRP